MDENVPLETTQTPQQPDNSRILKGLLLILLALVLLFAGAAAGYWYGTESAKGKSQMEKAGTPTPATITPEPTPLPTPTAPTDEMTTAEISEGKIAFLRDNNVHIINKDGTGEAVLTKGPINGRISAAVYARSGLISHYDCEGMAQDLPCTLRNTSISTKETKAVTSFERDASGFSWSNDMRHVAYTHIVSSGDNMLSIYDVTSDREIFARSLGTRMGRGGTYDDAFYTSFSPDDSKVLAVDTSSNPPASIFIFDLQGNSLAQLGNNFEHRVGANATFPVWESENSIVYKRAAGDSSEIVRYDILSGTEEVVLKGSEADGHDMVLSADKNKLAFWTGGSYDNETSQSLWVLDIKAKALKKLADGVVFPVWITDTEIVGVKVRSCSGTDCYPPFFEDESLNLVSIDGKNVVLTVNPGYPIPRR